MDNQSEVEEEVISPAEKLTLSVAFNDPRRRIHTSEIDPSGRLAGNN